MRTSASVGIVLAGLVAAVSVPAMAQQGAVLQQERTIRVTGIGETQVRPDQATILFAVETVGPTAQAAGRDNAQQMDRVIRALVAAGVPRADIETRGYSLHPDYAHDEGRREPRIRGYRAANQVMLRTGELERVGGFIDAALGAGANRMDGIAFGLRDATAAQNEALRSAVQAARASAEAIAGALGTGLGRVLDASTTSETVRPYPVAMEAAARMQGAPMAPTPIQPGEQTVRAHVTLVFAIAGS